MPGRDDQPAQEVPGWRLWISATGRHWALRCAILTAAQIAAGARPLLWAEDDAGLIAMIGAQEQLALELSSAPGPVRRPDLGSRQEIHTIAG